VSALQLTLSWLKLAQDKLDNAVFAAYGWPHDLSDEEILARLLALNLERAVRQGTIMSKVIEGAMEPD